MVRRLRQTGRDGFTRTSCHDRPRERAHHLPLGGRWSASLYRNAIGESLHLLQFAAREFRKPGWPVLVCLSQALLKLAAAGLIKLDLPKLNWSWYQREETVGQMRRRLVDHCRQRISRTLGETPTA